jgi:hypothetical protein
MTTPAEPTPATPAPAAPEPPKAEPPKVDPPAPEETPEQKIERLEAAIKAANAEAAKARTTAKQNAAEEARKELAQQIGKALGLVEDETPDPAKLTEQVSTATADAKQAKLELAVFHAAATAGADATALLDSRAFMTRLAAIEPADTAGITTAITEAVKANAALAVTPASRLPAPNPALGSSAAGAPDLEAQIAAAQKAGDVKLVIHLQNQKLAQASAQ